MLNLGKTLIVIAICFLSGCTLHFKATDLEVDAERQRVEDNITYELERFIVLSD